MNNNFPRFIYSVDNKNKPPRPERNLWHEFDYSKTYDWYHRHYGAEPFKGVTSEHIAALIENDKKIDTLNIVTVNDDVNYRNSIFWQGKYRVDVCSEIKIKDIIMEEFEKPIKNLT